ncbi:uncharacterized protein LOC126761611 isoform X1 [Bactrocera neohumeralis]|uniref:probable phospholipid hydroperoxide glutathione peroxidase isoform X1 n=1 Tax=Bactrocera tryoni TaxID=59916 RepID=UPI001A999742|nr:probable phospholipid hydroperoxide glutathione peroxidase isoform X1 [Bactrocera tryoni]XP_050333889.1 uncharacterized protein LOC126761611 isoform X1 [Bactrocera neohumeralis]
MSFNQLLRIGQSMANSSAISLKFIRSAIPQLQQQQLRQVQRCYSQFSLNPPTITSFNTSTLPNNKRLCVVLLPISGVSCAAASQLAKTENAPSSSTGALRPQVDDIDSNNMSGPDPKTAKTIYEFTVKDTHGNEVSLEKYKGNVVLVVNIASQCGLTKNNYAKLTTLLEKYEEKGLRILNFPCNQFNSQMPEADGEAMVCHLRDAKANIGDVFQKVDVNGSGAAPLYQFLKHKQTGTLGSSIKWNFTKFLVNKDGVPVDRYAPTTDPMDIAKDIEKLL